MSQPQHPGRPQPQHQPASGEWEPTNPPAPGPPPQRKSWFARHRILTAVLGILGFLVVVSMFTGGEDGTTASVPSAVTATDADAESSGGAVTEPASQPEPATTEPSVETDLPGIGDPVRDGKFEFVVTGVEDGGVEIGSEFLSERAQGRFHLVHVTVTNIGDEAQMMFDSNQQVRDEQGRSFAPNSMAGMYLDDNDVWLNEINPGNSVSGTLVFDMPDGAVPAEIELHDSAFSGGVTVSLR